MKSGENYIVSEGLGTKLVIYSYETGEMVKTLLDLSTFSITAPRSFSDFSFSADETKVLLITEREPIYRRSFNANYYVYDIDKQTITPLSVNGKQQVAAFSPDGTKVAFVRNNNIFIADLNSGIETKVTTDGRLNAVINGVPDWVYEEEFGFSKAYEWSPDGKCLAWIRFDESNVPQFSMNMFQGMEPSLDNNKLYPGVTTFKYPKAGEPNSMVSVLVYSLENQTTKTITLGSETDMYIPRIRFTQNPDQLAVFKLNRLKNKYEIFSANTQTGKTQILYTEAKPFYFHKDFV